MIIEKFFDGAASIVGVVLTFFMPLWYKKWKDKKKEKAFGTSLDLDSKINKIISEIRAKYGFNRSSILDYHNGTNSLSGFSFKNASMRYEDCDDNTKSMIHEFQNVPCSIVTEMLIRLERSDKGYIVATDDINETLDEETVITHKMFGISQAYNFRIGNSLIYGCLSLALTNGKIRLSEEEIIEIKAAIQKIFLLRSKLIK